MDIKNETLKKAYEGSYYTITGAGGDLQEWKDGYNNLLKENGIGEISEWVEFSGKDMNEEFDLIGEDQYREDLLFLAFPLDGLDGGKLALFKMRMRDRWFDDIVNNLVADDLVEDE